MNKSDYISLNLDLQQILTTDQAWYYKIVPKEQANDHITFYIDEKQDQNLVVAELEMLFGKEITIEKTSTEIIQKTLGKYYRKEQRDNKKTAEVKFIEESDDFLANLIDEAKGLNSSDIHIESYEERCRVRIRIDGVMVEKYALNKNEYPSIINKIKIMANLDIAEKRLPQDGRIFFNKKGNKFDIRVSVLPTLHGEKIVLRLLSNDAANIDIETLGFSKADLEHYLEGVKKPNGIILISGPTGSGKTTTLYATLKLLNKESRNILTIEDPIEYTLEGINQVQLKESIGLTFASALRTFLRQDPDIIMVGEIRDAETATMAIRASLTGHLVLSTIHTNSAWGTISRLTDMGVPPFLVADTLNTTVAQRLVRLLCKKCQTKEKFNPELFPKKFKPSKNIKEHYVAKGCEECYYTGYKGRIAIYEVISIDNDLADCIKTNNLDITHQLKEKGIGTLSENAFKLFAEGVTSLEEVYPVLMNH